MVYWRQVNHRGSREKRGNCMTESEYVSVAEAREILGVSKPRMAEILKKGLLAWEPNPVDERGKLIRRADVEALAAKAGKSVPGLAA
jgi:hypothetical protein